ncbi:hypothetical protein B0H14DRAFT_3870982 [Mycena olivaceomarginata]|nr:hypothetical protein B0H14DRAFT_3870982 [Mycena olivaceomarginata]
MISFPRAGDPSGSAQRFRNIDYPAVSAPKSSLVVNGTWFFSLGLTLISALAAVLAKGWLAQYTPATPGLRSKDACERHLRRLRYLRSREWRLAMIVAGIPLLIQIALLLFAVGLVVFTASDDSGISITLSVMTALTTCLYFLGTVLPWFSPACPFQTTMSDIIPGVAANRRYADSPEKQPPALRQPLSALQRAHLQWRKLTEFLKKTHHKPDRRQMEADVLAWMLTSSTDEKAIEEAVRAVAGANPTDDYLRDALYEFRPAIVDSLPKIVALLTDNDSDIRRTGADALAKLSEKDEFRPAIVDSLPKIVALLTDNDSFVRWAGADALAKLSEKGSRLLLSAKMGVRPTRCRRAPYALAARGCTSTTASADGGDVADPSTFELRLIPFGLRPGEGRIDVGVASSWNTGAAAAARGPALRSTVCVWVSLQLSIGHVQ